MPRGVMSGLAAALVVLVAQTGAATLCMTGADCNDGIFCNGVERCTGNERGRLLGLLNPFHRASPGLCRTARFAACYTPGGPLMRCDEAHRACVPLIACANRDQDGDGSESTGCGGDDCDDTDPHRFPGNSEICDAEGHDEDCDPSTFGVRDTDGDGADDARCCNLGEGGRCGTDCDDSQPGVHPSAPEVCDGRDTDCDGAVDEGVLQAFYPDVDGDLFGAVGSAQVLACQGGPHLSPVATDCDDTLPGVHPGVMVCGPEGPMVCQASGSYQKWGCGQGATTCLPQPTGAGICVP
jgi:hypothetical protein